jgi:hypothetical protein
MSWMTGDRFAVGAGPFLFVTTFRMAPWTIIAGGGGKRPKCEADRQPSM